MTYMTIPPEVGVGTARLKWVLREYLAMDLSAYELPSVIDLLPKGKAGILDEGEITERLPLSLVITTGPSGYTERIPSWSMQRFVLYAMAPERGLSEVEAVIEAVKLRINRTSVWRSLLVMPPTAGFRIEHLVAPAMTDTASYPAWKKDGRGIYVFVTISEAQTNSEY